MQHTESDLHGTILINPIWSAEGLDFEGLKLPLLVSVDLPTLGDTLQERDYSPGHNTQDNDSVVIHKRRIRIPPEAVQNGKRIRFEGLGAPNIAQNSYGDLRLTVNTSNVSLPFPMVIETSKAGFSVQTLLPQGDNLERGITVASEVAREGADLPLNIHELVRCTSCHGHGIAGHCICKTCDGTGLIDGLRDLTVRLPPNTCDGDAIIVKGLGRPGPYCGPPGDLSALIRVCEVIVDDEQPDLTHGFEPPQDEHDQHGNRPGDLRSKLKNAPEYLRNASNAAGSIGDFITESTRVVRSITDFTASLSDIRTEWVRLRGVRDRREDWVVYGYQSDPELPPDAALHQRYPGRH